MSVPTSALLAFVLLGCGSQAVAPAAYPDIAPGRYEKALETGGFKRTYILRVPKSYDKSKATPLLVFLHGFTGSGSTSERFTGMAEVAEKEGWLAVFPDGLGERKGWNAGFINLTGKSVDDVAFIGTLIDEVGKTLHVDPKRIYVAGHSNGAMMANAVAAKLPDRIAAIASVAGTTGLSTQSMIAKPTSPVSVLLIHGKLDPVVAYEPTASALLRGIGASASAEWWAQQIGSLEKPTSEEKPGYVVQTWDKGRNATRVQLVTILKGQHDWPRANDSGGVDAASLIAEFFRGQSKP